MTPKERVYARLAGEPVDRVPNLTILMAYASRHIGKPFGLFCTDYRVLTEANLACCETFGIDMLNTMSDAYRETAGFGAKVVFPHDNLPICTEHLVGCLDDVKRLGNTDVANSARCIDRVNAIRAYRETAGDHYPILGWVEAPFAEAADLRGVNEIMMDFYDEPGLLLDLMETTLAQGVAFARHQVEAGADFIGIGDAVASLVSPAAYREYVLPYEKRLIDAIHGMGARVKLHICGNTTALLADMAETGADIIDIDWMVDVGKATAAFGDKACVNGNFDPVAVVKDGSPADVAKAVEACLNAGDDRLFVSPGCEVPLGTPPDNLMAVRNALESCGHGSNAQ